MNTFTKPILAAPLLPPGTEHTDENIFAAMKSLKKWPVLATLKKDGIRALRLNSSLLSRTLKQIPNAAIRKRAIILPAGMDMELWNKDLDYCQVESIVMSREHDASELIQFHLLDWFGQAPSYAERTMCLINYMETISHELHAYVKFSPPMLCLNAEQLWGFFRLVEEQAGEGICFRTPVSPYKCGRSTLQEQYLVKLARYETSEAVITGFCEQLENTNRHKWNAIGNMDRSSRLEGMVGKDTLGAFECEQDGLKFTVGTGVGLTDALRQEIWDKRDQYLGKMIKIKSKGHGKKVKPRSPIFLGFRNPIDL